MELGLLKPYMVCILGPSSIMPLISWTLCVRASFKGFRVPLKGFGAPLKGVVLGSRDSGFSKP